MRVEPYGIDSYLHVIKRGAHAMPIVLDEMDKWRFILLLRHINDENFSEYWFRDLMNAKLANTLIRPKSWPKQKKIVEILCFCLMDNHFHLLLREIIDGGVSMFMQKLGTSMSMHYNEKYEEKGTIFQGAYKAKVVDNDNYLRYLSAYIQVKNTFELYPGGAEKAAREFDKSYNWACKFIYSSLGEYNGDRNSGIIDKGLLGEIFSKPQDYKKFARDFIASRSDFEIDKGFE